MGAGGAASVGVGSGGIGNSGNDAVSAVVDGGGKDGSGGGSDGIDVVLVVGSKHM